MPDIQVGVSKQPQTIEMGLKRLWEKIRTAADTIRTLRQEKAEMTVRIAALEREVGTLRNEATNREQEIKRLRAERAQLLSAEANVRFSDEEKDILKSRIRELIATINSHL